MRLYNQDTNKMVLRTFKKSPKQRMLTQMSHPLCEADKKIILYLLSRGFHQKRIAALFDVDSGRVAEVNRKNKKTKEGVV